jgi:hypothetical protein
MSSKKHLNPQRTPPAINHQVERHIQPADSVFREQIGKIIDRAA